MLISIYTYFIEWQTSFSSKMVLSWKRVYIFNAWILMVEIICWKPIALNMIHVRLLVIAQTGIIQQCFWTEVWKVGCEQELGGLFPNSHLFIINSWAKWHEHFESKLSHLSNEFKKKKANRIMKHSSAYELFWDCHVKGAIKLYYYILYNKL